MQNSWLSHFECDALDCLERADIRPEDRSGRHPAQWRKVPAGWQRFIDQETGQHVDVCPRHAIPLRAVPEGFQGGYVLGSELVAENCAGPRL